MENNFIDDLTTYLASKTEIEEAYFASLYHEEENKHHLFIGIAHKGNLEEIQKTVFEIKDKYYGEGGLHFTSTEDKPELFEHIKQTSFPFYLKSQPSNLNSAIMKQWFEPEKYMDELKATLKKSRVTALVQDMSTEEIKFQHFTKNEKPFIPLFSDEAMVVKTGMSKIVEDAAAISFQWDETVEAELKGSAFVLNPGSPFEIEVSL